MRDTNGQASVSETHPLSGERGLFWSGMRPRLLVYLDSFPSLDDEAKEDVLQRCLIAYWRSSSDLDDNPRSWLYRVARNAALDSLRSLGRERKNRLTGGRGEEALSAARSPYPRPEEAYAKAEEEAFVSRFLSSLPSRDRELLHLAFAEELGYPEISGLLGMPLGTVKWRIHLLKKNLAVKYGKEFGDGRR